MITGKRFLIWLNVCLTGLNYIIIKGSSGILNIANVESRKGGCKMLLTFWDNE